MSESAVHFVRLVFVLSLLAAALTAGFLFFGGIPLLGKLPGDMWIPLGGSSLYIPLSSSFLVSLVLTLIAVLTKPRSSNRITE